jgi:Immunoglobulin domain
VFTDSVPTCSPDISSPAEGENVTFTCDVSYTSNISPILMSWTDSNGQPVESLRNENQTGRTTSFITVPATFPAMSTYSCTTNFSEPTNLPATVTARNAPTYQHVWTSSAMTVIRMYGWRLLRLLATLMND